MKDAEDAIAVAAMTATTIDNMPAVVAWATFDWYAVVVYPGEVKNSKTWEPYP